MPFRVAPAMVPMPSSLRRCRRRRATIARPGDHFVTWVVVIAICLSSSWGWGQENELNVQTIVDQLRNPTGIAVQPETGVVFVAERGGYHILRIIDGQGDPAVHGFRQADSASGSPGEQVGPLAFVDRKTLLLIASSNSGDGNDVWMFSNVSSELGKKTTSSISSKYRIGRTATKDLLTELTDFALGGFSIFVTGKTADGAGWISKGSVADSGINKPAPHVTVAPAESGRTPTAIACSPRGFLTVGIVSTADQQTTTCLAFFDEDGRSLGEGTVDLAEVWGLAYHPLNGRLFALGRQDAEPKGVGLFHIVSTSDGLEGRAVLVLDLAKPTAMAFNPQGDLFVALQGPTTTANSQIPTGSVVKISGLEDPNPSWLNR